MSDAKEKSPVAKNTDWKIRVVPEDADQWELELCLDTLAALIYKYEVLPEENQEASYESA